MNVTKLCTEINSEMKRLNIHDYHTKFVSWEDVGRLVTPSGKISVCANVMNDVHVFTVDKMTKERKGCFVVGKNNLTDESVICSLDKLNCVTDSLQGGEAKMAKVSEVLKNFGGHFSHLGVDPTTNLLGGFNKVTLRVQVHVLELACDSEESLEEGNLVISVNNYQSRPDAAKCVNLLFTSQGVSAGLDCSPPGKPVDMFLQGLGDDDQLHNFAIGVEAVAGRKFSETGKQTAEEAQRQIEKERAAEVKLIDHPDMPKMSAVGHLYIPVKQKPMRAGAINVAAFTSLLTACPEVAGVDGVAGVDDDDMPEACFRSLGANPVSAKFGDVKYRGLGAGRAAPTAPPPKETCKAASVHRGCDMGVASPLQQKDLEVDEACGIPTFTLSIFMVKPPNKPFGTEDMKNAIDLANKVLKCASDDGEGAKPLNDKSFKEAGATVTSMSVDTAAKIGETFEAIKKQRISNVPVGIF